jgi:8-oxo-dGTP pyrophosphatase MutT (NUDIX family)
MTQPAIPNPASTVVLVRPERDGNFAIFMNRRPDKMDTYAGVYVFPGGRVEIDDWSEKMLALTRGLSGAQAQEVLGCDAQPELCLGYWVAAVRELFEEAGIYFFVPSSGGSLGPSREKLSERLAGKRRALQKGELDFPRLLESEQLHCDVSRLTYFFHRVTPQHYPVRFDTRFYLAALPSGQSPLHSSEEVAESLWIAPKEALDRSQSGGFPMMPPTLAVLRTLANYGSWPELSEAYRLA